MPYARRLLPKARSEYIKIDVRTGSGNDRLSDRLSEPGAVATGRQKGSGNDRLSEPGAVEAVSKLRFVFGFMNWWLSEKSIVGAADAGRRNDCQRTANPAIHSVADAARYGIAIRDRSSDRVAIIRL